MQSPTTPGARLRAARTALKLRLEDIHVAIGASKGAISRWETDEAELTQLATLALEHTLGFNSHWLLTGEGPMWAVRATAGGEGEMVGVPLIAGAASCGPGGEIEDPGPSALRIPFRSEFLQELLQETGVGHAANLFVVKCTGESMRPTILPGDLALINTALDLRLNPVRNALYLARQDPNSVDARIKRLRLDGEGHLCFLSDAPGFLPISLDIDGIPLQSVVLGRVCWVARSVVRAEAREQNW
jgi:phage repressor protein C with HTH and peptisase S24 domain